MAGYLNESKVLKAIFYQGKIALSYIVLLLMLSCGKSNDTENKHEYYEEARKRSLEISGDSLYSKIYKMANDTVDSWKKNKLAFYARFEVDSCQIDSLISFNSNANRAIMARLAQCKRSCSQDDIHLLYGVKVNKKWYFVNGPTVVIIRESYGFSREHPLPFSALHNIAIDNIYRGYIKWSKKENKWKINDDFFQDTEYSKWAFFDKFGNLVDNSRLTKQELDSLFIEKIVYANWRSRDSTNYKSQR